MPHLLPLLLSLFIGVPARAQEAAFAKPADAFEEFAWELEQTMTELDPSFFREHFDLEAFFAVVTEGVDRSTARSFEAGARSTFDLPGGLVEAMATFDGSFRFLRMMPGEPVRALFRAAGDDGLNYLALHLHKNDAGVRIVDVFPYTTGELMTTSFRNVLLRTAASQDRGLLARLFGKQSAKVEWVDRFAEMTERLATDPAGVLELYASLPEDLQREASVLMLRIQAASAVGDEVYARALYDLQRFRPEHPALPMMLLDLHLIHGDFEAAGKSIDALDTLVLGDPYLDILRGNIHLQANEPDRAREAIQRAVERDGTLQYPARWALLEVALTTDDHAATLALLVALEEEHGVEWSDLEGEEAYAAFVASPQYAEWLAR
jgi:hypothetical protein